jgi:hypothetical protein
MGQIYSSTFAVSLAASGETLSVSLLRVVCQTMDVDEERKIETTMIVALVVMIMMMMMIMGDGMKKGKGLMNKLIFYVWDAALVAVVVTQPTLCNIVLFLDSDERDPNALECVIGSNIFLSYLVPKRPVVLDGLTRLSDLVDTESGSRALEEVAEVLELLQILLVAEGHNVDCEIGRGRSMVGRVHAPCGFHVIKGGLRLKEECRDHAR